MRLQSIYHEYGGQEAWQISQLAAPHGHLHSPSHVAGQPGTSHHDMATRLSTQNLVCCVGLTFIRISQALDRVESAKTRSQLLVSATAGLS
jgi:hypothetical protein